MLIRRATAEDLEDMRELFRQTILKINPSIYSEEQLDAWSTGADHLERWQNRIRSQEILLAIREDRLAGMTSLVDGYIDLLYVHPDFQGRGIAGKLLEEVEKLASRKDLKTIATDASEAARPVFERYGFRVIRRNEVEIKSQVLHNYHMEKAL